MNLFQFYRSGVEAGEAFSDGAVKLAIKIESVTLHEAEMFPIEQEMELVAAFERGYTEGEAHGR